MQAEQLGSGTRKVPESFPCALSGVSKSRSVLPSLCVLWLWSLKDARAAAVTMGWHSDVLGNLKYFTGEKYTIDLFMKDWGL